MTQTELPPLYEFGGEYRDCFANPTQAMDKRHIFVMCEILRAWPFVNALELGSYNGASSTAFVEAINSGSKMIATFCDRFPSASLWNVTENCKRPSQLRITKEESWCVLESAEDFDFVLVDASHDLESVTKELDRLLIRKPLCVMAHDTNSTAAGLPLCEGAAFLKQTFSEHPEYFFIEDAATRPGEQTHRGLFFATKHPDLYRIAFDAFSKWCGTEKETL